MDSFIVYTVSICTLLLIVATPNVSGRRKPHIVYVLADDLGYNDVSYHGGSDIKTPCIDKLVSQGIKLENYYVQPICTPSRSQLMSGRYQIHTGLQHKVIYSKQPNALPLDNIILPQQLKRCGYDTYMVGKWHLGFYHEKYLPWNRGFDKFFGILTSRASYRTRINNEDRENGMDLHDSESGGPIKKYKGVYSTTLYRRISEKYIMNHNKSNPMFLYLSHQAVHDPLNPPPKSFKNHYKHFKNRGRRNYARMTASLDRSICQVTRALKSARMWGNTIFIFSTDNGGIPKMGGNNWPLRGGKRDYFEGGVKAVGFVAGRRINQRNITNKQLFHVSDWLPTLLTASECPAHPDTLPLDGIDQWDALVNGATPPRDEILFNIDPLRKPKVKSKRPKKRPQTENGVKKNGQVDLGDGGNEFVDEKTQRERIGDMFDLSVTAAIRKGPWKLISGDPGVGTWVPPPEYEQPTIPSNWEGPYELYNIELDPYEKKNVAAENPEVVRELFERLLMYNKTAVPVRFPDKDPNASPALNEGFWKPWIKN